MYFQLNLLKYTSFEIIKINVIYVNCRLKYKSNIFRQPCYSCETDEVIGLSCCALRNKKTIYRMTRVLTFITNLFTIWIIL